MPKEIRFRDEKGNSINSLINYDNVVFICINDDKLEPALWEYVCLSKEDLKDFIEHLNNLHEQL
jgi:hypothetical protein